jgi:hypothetical protein
MIALMIAVMIALMIAITIARIIVCPHYKQRRSNGSVKYKPY